MKLVRSKTVRLLLTTLALVACAFQLAIAYGWTCGDGPPWCDSGDGNTCDGGIVDVGTDDIDGYWYTCTGRATCDNQSPDAGKCNVYIRYRIKFNNVTCRDANGVIIAFLGICVSWVDSSSGGWVGLNRQCNGSPCSGSVADPIGGIPGYPEDLGGGWWHPQTHGVTFPQ